MSVIISNEKIEFIRSNIDIVNLISKFLKLKKKGNNFWAICPFHNDKNPSLSVSYDKQIYKCFSCSSSGNIFTFLQNYKKISFLEALKELSILYNINIKELEKLKNNDFYKKKYDEIDKKILFINNLAKNFFINNLNILKNKKAREYLQFRKINQKQIELFMIGYADNIKNSLVNFLLKKGLSLKIIILTGLIFIRKNISFDYFNNRIIFPIFDIENNIIGFSGRTFFLEKNEKKEVKYLNIPETKIFKKEKLIYTIINNKSIFINNNFNNDYIILVEGYMDLISLNKIKFLNVISMMGVNLSDYQINEIKKITNKCLLFLDGDEPGNISSIKISKKLLKNNLNVKIFNNFSNKDPDQLIYDNEINFINNGIKNSLHPVDFAINFYSKKYNLKNSDDLKKFIYSILELIELLFDSIEKDFFLNKLSEITNIRKDFFLNNKNQKAKDIFNDNIKYIFLNKINKNFNYNNKNYEIKNLKQYLLAEKNVILQLLNNRKVLKFYEVKICFLNDEWNRLIANEIIFFYNKYPLIENVDINLLFSEINDDFFKKKLLNIINNSSEIEKKYNLQALKDYKILIDNFFIEKEIQMLFSKINKTKNIIEKQFLSEEINKIFLRLKILKRGN